MKLSTLNLCAQDVTVQNILRRTQHICVIFAPTCGKQFGKQAAELLIIHALMSSFTSSVSLYLVHQRPTLSATQK